MDPQNQCFERLKLRRYFLSFGTSKYLGDKYFYIVWEYPPQDYMDPKNQFIEWLKLKRWFYLISVDI